MALTPEEMEQIPNAISNAFSELEIGIFEDLIGRIKENNEITGTAEYDIFKLIQLGESEKVIKNYVRKALKITYSEIEEIFGDVFETGYNRDNDLFKAVGADFIAYKDNEPLQQYIAAIKEQTRGTYKNITNTMGFVRQREGTNTWVPLTKYYKDSLTRAVIEITSGSFSYTQVVKKIINEMTNSGIRTIDYASGKTSRIEVAARRAIQTAVTQVAAKVTEQNMEKLHTEYVEVSWHATARPTHQVWQGRVFRWNRGKENKKTEKTAKGENTNIVYRHALNEDVFETYLNPRSDGKNTDVIIPRNIIKALNKNEAGKRAYEFLKQNNIQVCLLYNVDNPLRLSGEYDIIENKVRIYVDVTKSIQESARTIVHETTHARLGATGTKKEEVLCFLEEARYCGIKLTNKYKRDIIKQINQIDVYDDLPWR